MHGDNSKAIRVDDWNNVYNNTWPTPTFTYSKKWEWHYRDTPYIKYVSTVTSPFEDHPYKKGGPRSSEMYKKLYPANIFNNAFVNDLGDL
jgi:hypothetical protein